MTAFIHVPVYEFQNTVSFKLLLLISMYPRRPQESLYKILQKTNIVLEKTMHCKFMKRWWVEGANSSQLAMMTTAVENKIHFGEIVVRTILGLQFINTKKADWESRGDSTKQDFSRTALTPPWSHFTSCYLIFMLRYKLCMIK